MPDQRNGSGDIRHSDAMPADLLAAKLEAFKADLIENVRHLNEQLLSEHAALKPLLSVEDVAKTLAVSCRTVETLIAAGDLRPLWIRGQRRFHPDAVDAFLRNRGHATRRRKARQEATR